MHPLLVALQFLTRVPVAGAGCPSADQVRRSLAYYPAVGAIIGGVLWCCSVLLADLGPVLHAAMLLAIWVGLSGALHLDGLADSVDASAGSRGDWERARVLLKDPRCGAMGATALSLVLLLKFAALTELTRSATPWLLLLPPVLARAAVVVLFATTQYVSKGGLGAHLSGPGAQMRHGSSLAAAALLTWLAAGAGAAAWVALVVALTFVGVRAWLRRAFGGVTGDGAGALVEISEIAALLALVAVAN